ncbi:VOC family protein [Bacillus luteolus]|uniref:VOC family protein n=1 Tax=Litchfieldia luteola TaxID=682179 RepID=A0ABR9QNM3_9BACI|nr:VOC family protein [Cytobacillus luteolus]MBE4910097.1 VOC family protein [Cytobacillus luteolus]MBP1942339.1 catechol 2,3-dioxygenase-like lactoylglutathione lyase family enzyme [Cytobacillus luteolus]
MNGYLYETHVLTKNLEEAVQFYQKLGMPLAYLLEDRRSAFFWFQEGKEKKQMLGVWEVAEDQWVARHFAFHVSYEEIMGTIDWLKELEIESVPSFGLEPKEPLVLCWMPAASVYFKDPDGNSLEYIHVLDGESKPELGVIHYSEWQRSHSV